MMEIVPWQLLIVGAVVTVVRPQTPVDVTVRTEPPGVVELISSTYIELVCEPNIGSSSPGTITFAWTGPSGPISTGSEYTVIDQAVSSTLRIDPLSTSHDSDQYTCLVSGNVTGSDSLVLSVRELNSNDFETEVSFPFTPTAGDNITITCNVTGPDRLTITLVLTWEVQIRFGVIEDVSDAVDEIGVVTIEDTVSTGSGNFSKTLSFTRVNTSQARRYGCKVFFSAVIGETQFVDLHVQIPPPVVTVSVDPAVDPIYSSTAINLTCTAVLAEEVNTATLAVATWTGPTGATNDVVCQQPNVSRICVVEAVSVGNGMFTSVLVFHPVDHQKDDGVHTCDMTINSNTTLLEDNFIESNSNNESIEITVEELPSGVPTVSVTASGSTEVGQSLILSCSVTLEERMVVSPGVDYNITWMKIDTVSQGVIGEDINIPTLTVMGDPTTTVTLEFGQLRFEDRGTYICIAELNVTHTLEGGEDSEEVDVVVDFPPVTVELSKDYEDPLYAGTNLTLTCSTDLDETLVNIPVALNSSWTKDNAPVIIDSTHLDEQPLPVDPVLLTSTATYSFAPLDDRFDSTDSSDMGDSGAYQCVLTVMAEIDSFVTPRSASSTSDSINVLALPAPAVTIVTDGSMMIGEPLLVTCVVDVVDRLIVEPIIVWDKNATSESVPANDISVTPRRVGNNSTLNFTSLASSDAGQYTCRAYVTSKSIGVIDTTLTGSYTQSILLPIPSVEVSLTRSREGVELFAGSTLTLTADISVHSNVNTPHTVSAEWYRNGSLLPGDERVNVSNVFDAAASNQYRTEVVFSSLSSTIDSGMYTCMVQVDSGPAYPYVASTPGTSSMTIDVKDPDIVLSVGMDDDFVAVPTSCNYSEEFAITSLTCYASKPVEVIPELKVIWLLNGNEIEGEVNSTAINTTATTVKLDSEEFADISYTCSAELIIPNSPVINVSRGYEVIFKGSESRIFQLKLTNVSRCADRTVQSSILSRVRSQVTEGVRSRCDCEFQERLIYQSVLFCNEPDSAVFRAMIFSSAVYSNVDQLVKYIDMWVQSGISITTDGGEVTLDPAFPIIDSSLSDLECAEPSVSSTPTESTAAISDAVVIAVVAVCIALIAILLFAVVIVVCRYAWRKRKLGSPTRNGISAVQFTTFAEPLKVDLEDNFEISQKVDISNGGKEANGEVTSSHSHPDQSDPVVNQYNSLGREKCMFAEPIKPEEPSSFDDNLVKSTTPEESDTAASPTTTNPE